ncbi:MAG: NUDIX domain-containing protein, partial [bacterium]|nr:NUDIX domain-containing protein [bacterium]
GAFAIIADEQGRILLAHRTDRDAWNLPGGKVETGESPWDGVVREIWEEVDVRAAVDELVDVSFKPQTNEIVFTFRCHIIEGRPGLSDEADVVDWFAWDALPTTMVPRQAERVRGAFEASDRCRLRVQE